MNQAYSNCYKFSLLLKGPCIVEQSFPLITAEPRKIRSILKLSFSEKATKIWLNHPRGFEGFALQSLQ